jgi:3-oxoadipate enol-lactonase
MSQMQFEEFGGPASSGPPILAVHGLGGGAYFFRALGERIQSHHRLLAIDLPVTSPQASMTSWVEAIGTFVDERAGQPVVLVGHSMGTILALHAWAAWPERIRAMVFVGGVPRVLPRIHDRLSERADLLERSDSLAGWGRKVSPGVFSPATFATRPEVVEAFERLFEMQSVADYVRCCRILIGADASAIVPTVTVPCLAVTGEDDQYAPPDAVAAFVARLPVPPPVAVIDNAGHLPFLEQPDAFAAVVKTFLRTC